jgi:hypothetical protein
LINEVKLAKKIFDDMISGAVKMLKGGELEGVTISEG